MQHISTGTPWMGLDELPAHGCATVRAIDMDDEDSQRLKTLGLCVGRQVELLKRGNPLIVRVFSSRLGLSASLASRVRVEACASNCVCPVLQHANTP